jgi:hypothetical protein
VNVGDVLVCGTSRPSPQRMATLRRATWPVIAMVSIGLSGQVRAQSAPATRMAASEVYIEQSRGQVSPGATILTKPPPEATTAASPSITPTAPETCNAQNASSQACYTATQQARPGSR